METHTPNTKERSQSRLEQFIERSREKLQRASELMSKWLQAERDTPLVVDPELDHTDATDAAEREFFSEEVPLANFDAKMQRRISPTHLRRLMTGLAFIGAVESLAVSCDTDAKSGTEDTAHETDNSPLEVQFSTEQGFAEMHLPGNQIITVMDYNAAEGAIWNIPLDESRALQSNNSSVQENSAYQYHVRKFYERVHLSDTDIKTYMVSGKRSVFSRIIESGRMDSGLNAGFEVFYGNMDLGDTPELERVLVEKWKAHAESEGWDSNFDDLTSHQWMQLIQLAGSEITYDQRLGNAFPSFDANLTAEVKDRTIEELIDGGVGVCRDKERLNIASYVIADQLYDLSNRGLLYYPMTNISDAKHTRGMFLVVVDSLHTASVGVDTTNLIDGDVAISGGDTSPIDTTGWYLQDTGSEWMRSLDETSSFYEEFLSQYGSELAPTTRAMVSRELAVTESQIALEYYTEFEKTEKMHLVRESVTHLTKAFQTIKHELELERYGSSTYYLNLPVRQIHLLDGLLVSGRGIDTLQPDITLSANDTADTIGPYYGMALTMYAEYMDSTGLTKEEIEAIRNSPESIQFNQQETIKINQAIQERLKELKDKVE